MKENLRNGLDPRQALEEAYSQQRAAAEKKDEGSESGSYYSEGGESEQEEKDSPGRERPVQ